MILVVAFVVLWLIQGLLEEHGLTGKDSRVTDAAAMGNNPGSIYRKKGGWF
jgi:hypothetical protein